MATGVNCSVNDDIGIVHSKPSQNFVVMSWNVLHIIHELNYVPNLSLVLNHYSINENLSNEKLRLHDIIKVLRKLLSDHSTMECFICLQEVPGDLLPMLIEMSDSHIDLGLTSKPLIHIHVYSRKPMLMHRQGDSPYVDPNESLVTIHYNPCLVSSTQHIYPDDRVLWTPCPTDAGKGALTLMTTSGLTVVNVHVPYDNQAATLLLSNIPWSENSNGFVCVGDMNRYSETLMKMIAEVTADKDGTHQLYPIKTEKPTRVGMKQDGTHNKTLIDHFVISASLKGLVNYPAIVFDDIGDISDHYPILLEFKDQ
ncbi:unnamed protein product [Rotaria socialis]|uniref:Endonuclease/exonuclease/phosphatase domain-containing protein n=1 Tax=Rotaria socialis TaxID=392032 RepID=A0A820FKU1_9BILA|nr:unnamed protein product [Rotaria socialis]CAF4266069.1 unnamed protein product [Rotaria socialis]